MVNYWGYLNLLELAEKMEADIKRIKSKTGNKKKGYILKDRKEELIQVENKIKEMRRKLNV